MSQPKQRKSSVASLCLLGAACVLSVHVNASGQVIQQPVDGFSIAVPSGWYVLTGLSDEGLPLVVGSFPRESLPHGGLVPDEHTEIAVRSIDPARNTESILLELTRGQENVVRTSPIIGGLQAERFTYTLDYDNVRITGIIIRKAGRLFFLNVTHGSKDPLPNAIDITIDEIVVSLTVGQE